MYGDEQPALLPVRMLNEFVYCPRLFYLEWVDQLWESNDDTAEGVAAHRVTDRRRGRMPEPTEELPPLNTTQVKLEDEFVGLVAVVDRVDHHDGSCTPVDIKKGRAPVGGGAWPADRIQVMAQAVLLERAGYQVTEAKVAYRGCGTMVDIPYDAQAHDEVVQTAAQARATAARIDAPLPLLRSPKCVRCSLAGLCMPDEVNALLGRDLSPPRRILPRDRDQRPLYVTTQGARVGVTAGRLVVTAGGENLAELRLIDVSHVAVFGHVQVSTEAMTQLWKRGVVVLWLSRGGWLNGWAQPPMGKHVELRRRQVVAHAAGIAPAAAMIQGKIRNQRTMLRRNSVARPPASVMDSLTRLAKATVDASTIAELLGLEGTAARLYFEHLPRMFQPEHPWASEFAARGRRRRPPTDPINALLGFTYSLLVKEVLVACLGCGLDPYLGLLHRSRYGRPSLALDLAEEFRPLIAESVTIQVVNNGEVDERSMRRHSTGVTLTSPGRKAVIRAFERRMTSEVTHPVFAYRISYRRVIDVQARLLAAVVMGEIDTYPAMVTR